jgi:hypothetical protein
MLKKVLFRAAGPMAAAAFPLFSLYSNNLDWVTLGQILLPLGLLLAAAVVVYAFCAAVFRSIDKACLIATCFITIVFAYGLLVPFKLEAFSIRTVVAYQVLLFLLGALAIYAFLSRRPLSAAADVVSIVAVTVLCVPVAQVLWFQVEQLTAGTFATPGGSPDASTGADLLRPDIYHIVLDGYTRQDVLQELYGVDNTPFLDALRQRGFYVASGSRSNYLQTLLSLTSTFNMTYLNHLKGPTSSADLYRRYLQKCIRKSAVLSELRAHGYTYVRFVSALGNLNAEAGADVELSPVAKTLNTTQIELLDGLLRASPWRHNLVLRMLLLKSSQPLVPFQFQTLRQLKPQPERPQFVFAHILCPHPPFVFDRNGNIAPNASANLSDGSDFGGTLQEYQHGYIEQLLYVNREVLKTIDAILKNYPPDKRPVIIIQGDHGSGSHYNQESAEKSLLWERSSILNVYLVPDGLQFAFYESITPVNSYRVLFNGLFKRDFKMLPDRTFFAPYKRPYEQRLISEDRLVQNSTR